LCEIIKGSSTPFFNECKLQKACTKRRFKYKISSSFKKLGIDMYVIVMWFVTALITWFGLSAIMFVFSMGNFSSIEPYKKQYWK
jgi:hypothetical protein